MCLLYFQSVVVTWHIPDSSRRAASTSAQQTTSGYMARSVTAVGTLSQGRWSPLWDARIIRSVSSAACAGEPCRQTTKVSLWIKSDGPLVRSSFIVVWIYTHEIQSDIGQQMASNSKPNFCWHSALGSSWPLFQSFSSPLVFSSFCSSLSLLSSIELEINTEKIKQIWAGL